MTDQPISRSEALRVSRATLERAEQEHHNQDLLLARYVVCRYALEGRAWAVALEKYLQELEAKQGSGAGIMAIPCAEVDWEQAPMEAR